MIIKIIFRKSEAPIVPLKLSQLSWIHTCKQYDFSKIVFLINNIISTIKPRSDLTSTQKSKCKSSVTIALTEPSIFIGWFLIHRASWMKARGERLDSAPQSWCIVTGHKMWGNWTSSTVTMKYKTMRVELFQTWYCVRDRSPGPFTNTCRGGSLMQKGGPQNFWSSKRRAWKILLSFFH